MHQQQTTDKYTLAGIYRLTCPACNKAYMGQAEGNFTVSFNEHKHAFRTKSHTSKFAQHLVEHNHSFGTIHNILENNSFPIRPQKPSRLKLRKQKESNPIEKQKCATFTYVGRETTFITNIFRRTNIKIAFHTNNSIGNRLMHEQQTINKYTLSGIYRFTCPVCNKVYVGQTGRTSQ